MNLKITPTSITILPNVVKKAKADSTEKRDKHISSLKNKNDFDKYCKSLNIEYVKLSDDDISNDFVEKKERCLSSRTKNKIRNRLTYYYYLCKKKGYKRLTFFTLTLTSEQQHTDEQLNIMLNTFLTRLRQLKSFDYTWVAERQKNGNRHYHIVFNKYFRIDLLNYYWCKVLDNNGYSVKLPRPYIIDDDGVVTFQKKPTKKSKFLSENCSNPVDCDYIYNIKTLSYYLSKYVSKSTDTSTATCYHNSRYFSQIDYTLNIPYCEDLFRYFVQNNEFVNKEGKVIKVEPFVVVVDWIPPNGKLVKLERCTYMKLVNHNLVEQYYSLYV